MILTSNEILNGYKNYLVENKIIKSLDDFDKYYKFSIEKGLEIPNIYKQPDYITIWDLRNEKIIKLENGIGEITRTELKINNFNKCLEQKFIKK